MFFWIYVGLNTYSREAANAKGALQNHFMDDSGMIPWQESFANCSKLQIDDSATAMKLFIFKTEILLTK